MGATSLLKVKQLLRRCTKKQAEIITDACFEFCTAAEVDDFLKSSIKSHFSECID